MQLTLALVAAAASFAAAQGVTGVLTPTASAPAGCSTNYNGNFEITVVLPSRKRDVAIERRAACGGSGTLVAKLSNGILTDSLGRIGAIVANRQFQFDGPPAQTGSIYTGGWSVCNNGSLAIGGTTVFYQCLSGTFYNLYDRSTGPQCNRIEIDVIPCTVGGATAPGATQISDGQIQASSAVTRVSQISDGQIQATSAGVRVTQISDGQIQATSAVARPPVSQFTDGQLQVTAIASSATRAPVTQISDGQIQVSGATTRATSTASRAPVTQISDGQIQVSGATSRASTTAQIVTTTRAPVVQISDGQIQASAATNRTTTTTARATFTGAAAPMATLGAQLLAGAAAVAGLALL